MKQLIAKVGASFWLVVLTGLYLAVAAAPEAAEDRIQEFIGKVAPGDLVPGGEHFGRIAEEAPIVPILDADGIVGHAALNSDLAPSIGYSGKPIDIMIGLDTAGVLTGARLVKHHEPIVLIGIPETRVTGFIDGYVGRAMSGGPPAFLQVDAISGATVTMMVIDDSIVQAARKVARHLTSGAATAQTAPPTGPRPIPEGMEVLSWPALLDHDAVSRLTLTVGEVTDAFAVAGNTKAADRPESPARADTLIDLYVGLASIPVIGRSMLGEAEYALLAERLAPAQAAIVIAGNGLYSFKGSGYVRGGLFDRIRLLQDPTTVRFRDRNHKRIGDIMADGAPKFREIALFTIPVESEFDGTAPWDLDLLIQRAVGPTEKAFIARQLTYTPPLVGVPVPAPNATPDLVADDEPAPLWQRIWSGRTLDIAILTFALLVLTGVFFFQNILARHPKWVDAIRIGFLWFTVLWIGVYAQAQLSVVNVLTFANALLSEFRWEYFLTDPLLFILWFSVAASLLFWGRGAYCGWLCPFGALQELLNRGAKRLRIPQVQVPWGVHERLWPIKYMLFLGLFGISLYSLSLGEQLSEVEPFKTTVILYFDRTWPFVVYAVALLVAGLFIERFFCRYLCPLGAALAIPARLRMFEWLKRHRECGNPCHICANECMVQSIHPDGRINPNECLYCLNCQTLYFDQHRCPPMIRRRLKRERRQVMQSTSMATGGDIVTPRIAADRAD